MIWYDMILDRRRRQYTYQAMLRKGGRRRNKRPRWRYTTPLLVTSIPLPPLPFRLLSFLSPPFFSVFIPYFPSHPFPLLPSHFHLISSHLISFHSLLTVPFPPFLPFPSPPLLPSAEWRALIAIFLLESKRSVGLSDIGSRLVDVYLYAYFFSRLIYPPFYYLIVPYSKSLYYYIPESVGSERDRPPHVHPFILLTLKSPALILSKSHTVLSNLITSRHISTHPIAFVSVYFFDFASSSRLSPSLSIILTLLLLLHCLSLLLCVFVTAACLVQSAYLLLSSWFSSWRQTRATGSY